MNDRKRIQAQRLTKYQIQETALHKGDIFEIIKRAKREWEATVDALPQAICLLDGELKVLRANQAVERWGLAEVDKVKGMLVHDLFHPVCEDSSCAFKECLEQSRAKLQKEQAVTCKLEDEYLDKYLQIQVQPISGTQNRWQEDVVSAVLVVQDITEEMEAHLKLESSRDYYQNLLNNLHEQVLLIDDQHLIIEINQAFQDNICRPREEILGEPCYRIINDFDQPCYEKGMNCPVVDVMETGETKRSLLHAYAPENTLGKWLDVVVCALEELNRESSHFLIAFRDVTSEQRLKKSLDGVYELGRELIFARDSQTIIQTVLDTAQILVPQAMVTLWLRNETKNVLVKWGYRDGTHVVALDEIPADKRIDLVTKALTRGQITYDYLSSSAPNGKEERGVSALAIPLLARLLVKGVLSVEGEGAYAFDMRDRKILSNLAIQIAVALENAHLYEAEREQRKLLEQSQAQLVQSEKLAATGRLIASLAHEINNPLQTIHNSLQIMQAYEIDEDEKEEYLSMINEEVTQLIKMMKRMLDFARKPQQKKDVLDINQIIEKTFNLSYKYLEHSNIKLAKHLSPDLPPIRISAGEMKQVFLNLLVNAVDAMEDGGKLEVSSYRENEYLKVVFSDTGKGIAAEDMDHIFEPFFSTKEGGTGLGLSTSYKIIKQHGGDMEVQSKKGGGATFTVRIPL